MTIISVTSAKLHLFDIVFDDGTNGSIDKTVWKDSGYIEGDSLEQEDWDALCVTSDVHRAKEKALYYLSLREYGTGELVQKLCRAGIARELARETVERLASYGIVDDERCAAILARSLCTRKHYPRRRIAATLKEKGFSSETIENALCELPEEDTQQALELLIKKGYNGKSDLAARDKMLAKLARYGFSYSTAKKAMALYEEQCEDEEFI